MRQFSFPVTWAAIKQQWGVLSMPDDLLTRRDEALEDFLQSIPQSDHGTEVVTTDAGGRATIAHLLGRTPATVLVSSAGPDTGTVLASVIAEQSAWTDVDFVVRLLDNTGAAIASTGGLSVAWHVLA